MNLFKGHYIWPSLKVLLKMFYRISDIYGSHFQKAHLYLYSFCSERGKMSKLCALTCSDGSLQANDQLLDNYHWCSLIIALTEAA